MPERQETPHTNSLAALHLVTAAMVLFSYHYAMLGLSERLFTPCNCFCDASVAIFIFLCGFLVWTSWARDPSVKRFFQRRVLGILLALLMLCLLSVFVLGPLVFVMPATSYFGSVDTWLYLVTALLVSSKTLPSLYGHNVPASKNPTARVIGCVALLAYALPGPRFLERGVMLVFAALLVHVARNIEVGAHLTQSLGDVSYGLYIFAFPVQQIGLHFGQGLDWSVSTYLCISVVVTGLLAYLSWRGVDKQALRFKPASA